MTIDTTNAQTQLQYKIDNLLGSETEFELKALKATADKYPDVNTAPLDSAIQVFADGLNNASTITEVAAVAQSSFERMTNFNIINSVQQLNVDEDLYIDKPTNTHWLRSGVLETDISKYPDARRETIDYQVDGSPSNIGVGNWTNFVFNGSSYWIINRSNQRAYELDMSLTPTGTTLDFSSQISTADAYGLCWDGSYYYICRFNGQVYRYDSSWVYQDLYINTSAETTQIRSMDWDGNFFNILSDDKKVYVYSKLGMFTGESYSVDEKMQTPFSIRFNKSSNSFFISDASGYVYEYSLGKVLIDVYNLSSINTSIVCAVPVDGVLFISSDVDNTVTKLIPLNLAVGIKRPVADSDSNLSFYIRVK